MDQDIFQNVLWDVFWGNIWNLDADHSLAHPNCRCQLAVRVETASPEAVREMLATAKALLPQLQSLLEALRSQVQ
jgi:hypothetical protein